MPPPDQLAFGFTDAPVEPALAPVSPSARPSPKSPGLRSPTESTPPTDAEADRLMEEAARTLAAGLSQRLGAPVQLVVTDNRSAMFSAKRKAGRVHVRANHIFLEAGPAILDAMAAAVGRDPEARADLRAYIRARRERIKPSQKPARRTHVRTRGAHHDLARLFSELERVYFPDAMTGVKITWGPALGRRRRRRRSIQLGLYLPDDRLIRIHRALDQAWVPRFYVESVVFHEMLHHCMPPIRRGRQVIFHTPQFRALERVFPYFEEAERWERAHLDRLLSS